MHGTANPTSTLRTLRRRFYASARAARADALSELTDAILTAGSVPSVPHLSLAAVHRRRWGSLYAALSKGRLDEEALRAFPARRPRDHNRAQDGPSAYAVYVTAWPRCDAEASPGRGYYYHPSRHSAGQPIVAGWAYQLVVGLSFERDSWVTPMDVRRVPPELDANDVATDQIRALVRRLEHKPGDTGVPRGRRTSGELGRPTWRKHSRLREVATQPRPRSADA